MLNEGSPQREGIFNSPGIVKRRSIMALLLASRVIKLGIILVPQLISKLVLFRNEMEYRDADKISSINERKSYIRICMRMWNEFEN